MESGHILTQASKYIVPVGSLLVILTVTSVTAFWVWSIIDALRRDPAVWRTARQSRLFWVAVIVLLPPLGSLAYVLLVKPSLKRSRASASV